MVLIRRAVLVTLVVAALVIPGTVRADFAAYSGEVMADNPLVYLHLDELSGTVAADSSGNGLDGTYVGGVVLGGPGAMAGSGSPLFDGASGYVDLVGQWGAGSTVTVECWANLNALTGNMQAMVSALDTTFVHLQAHNGGNNVCYTDAGTVALAVTPDSPLGAWRHVVMVIEPGNSRIYIDGAPVSTDPLAFTNILATGTIRVGSGYLGGRFFSGGIDEVAIYLTALSDEQVLAHHAAAMAQVAAIPLLSGQGVGLLVLLLACLGVMLVRLARR